MNSHLGKKTVTWGGYRILACVLLAVVGLVGCSNTDQGISRRDHAAELQTEVARRMAREIELVITGYARELELLTQVSGFGDLPEAEQRLMLSELLSFDPAFDELWLLDDSGQEVIRLSRQEIVPDSDLQDRSNQPEFTRVIEMEDTYFGPVIFDPSTGEPLMAISVPIVDMRVGQIAYVLVGQFQFRTTWEIIHAQTLSQGQDLYLVDGNSRIVAHTNPSVMLADTRFETQDIGTVTTGLNGDQVVIGLAHFMVGEQEFTMIAELETAVVDK